MVEQQLEHQNKGITLYNADCLSILPKLNDESIDLILVDLPYGTTYATWDKILPIDVLWKHYTRIIKGNGAIIFTASQPFTSLLVSSNLPMFRCEWIWDKVNAANFANANKQPLKQHESILVFAKGQPPYYPIKTLGKVNHKQGKSKVNVSETRLIKDRVEDDLSGLKFPKTIIQFPKHSSQCGLHPTQKPVELMKYLINTYSLPDETVLDNCMGSGTTGVACIETNRKFIGIENNSEYFEIAKKRLQQSIGDL